MAKFETVPLAELKTRLPAKLTPLVEEYKAKLGKLGADQGGAQGAALVRCRGRQFLSRLAARPA